MLIDSTSGSAAEVFARIIQIEKRGTVIGDRSAGAVMEGEFFRHAVYVDPKNVTQYGVMISIADLMMTDGKSLEGVRSDTGRSNLAKWCRYHGRARSSPRSRRQACWAKDYS